MICLLSPKGYETLSGSRIFNKNITRTYMKKLSEVPFISISNENLMAAADMLDREQMGELMEMIIDAVLNDGYPSSDNKCVNGVFKQFMAVIERKAKGYANRVEPLEKINEERKKKQKEEEPQVSAQTPLNECINDLMALYNEKGYESMIYRINHKCREWGYPFEVLKAKCDSIIEENIVYGDF